MRASFQSNLLFMWCIYIRTLTTIHKIINHLFLVRIWCSICWLNWPVAAHEGSPFSSALLYERGQHPADRPQAHWECQRKLSLRGVSDEGGMVWRKHRGERRWRRRMRKGGSQNNQHPADRCMQPRSVGGGGVMTSEKQREQTADSRRAVAGWLHPHVRAELASFAVRNTHTWT